MRIRKPKEPRQPVVRPVEAEGPRAPGREAVIALQRSIGNAAVARLLADRSPLLALAGVAANHGAEVGGICAVQRKDDPNVTPVPQVGQAPLDLKAQYVIRYLYREMGAAGVRALAKEVLKAELPTAVLATKADVNFPFDPLPTEPDAVLAAYESAVDGTAYDNSYAAYDRVWKDASLGAILCRYTLIGHLHSQLKAQFVAKAREKYKRLDLEVAERQKNLKAVVGAGADAPTKVLFAKALRSLPGLRELLADVKSRAATGATGASAPGSVVGTKETVWKDGGKLVDKIVKELPTTNESAATDTTSELATFTQAIQQADNFYRRLVEADVLKKIPQPTVAYHLVNAFDRVGGNVDTSGKSSFVANQDGAKVHLGQGVFPHIVVHEVGHYIEDNLPRKDWLDIQLLMQGRHTQAGGGSLVAGPGGARLGGDYPATGPYTSRAYTTGTEVSSMTMERLAQGNELDVMIDNDPQLVALVIRTVRPQAYAAHTALRHFDKYLP